MTYEKAIKEAVDIILENILTPVLYMYIDEAVEFIVFSDSRALIDETLRNTEAIIYNNLGIKVEIVDIREFDEADRSSIMKHANIVYSESDEMLSIFESAMLEELELKKLNKLMAIMRKHETGTYYVS